MNTNLGLKFIKSPVKVIQCYNDKGESVGVKLTGRETLKEAMEIISNSCNSEEVQELSSVVLKGLDELGSKRA